MSDHGEELIKRLTKTFYRVDILIGNNTTPRELAEMCGRYYEDARRKDLKKISYHFAIPVSDLEKALKAKDEV